MTLTPAGANSSGRPTRHIMTAQLRPEMIEHYDEVHASPPPAVFDRLSMSKLRDYVIVRSGSTLFVTFEYHGSDLTADLSAFRAEPALHDWMAATDACLLPAPDGSGRRWVVAREIFRAP